MTIEPLRRDVAPVRRPGLRAGVPTSRTVSPPSTQQMCVVVTEVADGDGAPLVRNLRRRGAPRVVVLTRRASRPELGILLQGGLRRCVPVVAYR